MNLNIEHYWVFDWPWHIVNKQKYTWLYLVAWANYDQALWLQVRVFGLRSVFKLTAVNTEAKEQL